MRALVSSTLLALLLAGCSEESSSGAAGLAAKAGPFRVEARFEPDPPQKGTNVVALTVTNAAGEPVDGASVQGAAVMPAMGAMPEMRAGGKATSLGDGRYDIEVDLSMTGTWPLTVTIMGADGATGSVGFNYQTGIPVRLSGARKAGAEAGAIDLDARQRQLIGVKTADVAREAAEHEVLAVGRVAYDETTLTDVTLKFQGWIGEVFADTTGDPVAAGAPLFTVYSPELLSAQEEYLESARRGSTLLPSARRRLLLWNLTSEQIDQLRERGRPLTYVPILSPASGIVVEKNVVDGSAVKEGQLLYRIADLSTVWVEADVYEADLGLVAGGQRATVSLSYVPGQSFEGVVDYVYPYLDLPTRTGRVRLVVPNEAGSLKPGMYADVALRIPLGLQVVVPEGAILRSGKTDLAFVDLGDGRFEPRRVELGRRTTNGYVVSSGLDPGETVVTSGNFLIAAESRLKAGIDKW